MKSKATVKRIITTTLIGLLLMGATGCSVIMGVFGSEETAMNDTNDSSTAASRTLMPTPTTISVEVASAITPPPTATTAPTIEQTEEHLTESQPQTQPAPVTPAKRKVTLTGDAVNLRSGPGTDSPILRTAPAGTTFDFVDQNSPGDWYQVCCVDNALAWVYAQLATLEEAATPAIAEQTMVSAPAAPPATTAALVLPALPEIPLPESVFTEESVANGIRYEYSEQGFAITLPTEWQPFDLSPDGLNTDISAVATENPGAAALVQTQLQSLVNARFTFFAAALTPDLLTTGYVTTVSLWKQPLPEDISLELYTQITAKQIQAKFGLTTPVSITPRAVPAGRSVILTYSMSSGPTLGNRPLSATQYLIMQGQTVYAFTFTTTPELAEAYAATFATIAESFQLLDQ